MIGGDGAAPAAADEPPRAEPAAAPAPRRRPRDRARPRDAARPPRGQELGVDLAAVPGTGPQGRITEDDVRAAASGAPPASRLPPAEGERREPLRGVRKLIAQHLATSHREVPAVTVVEECDFTDARPRPGRAELPRLPDRGDRPRAARRAGAERAPRRGRDRLSSSASTSGSRCRPTRGSSSRSSASVDSKRLDELEAEGNRLAEAAREGTLKPEELRGSTFTVSSGGKLGGLFATPLVNYPEVGILGLHRIARASRRPRRRDRRRARSAGSRARSTTACATACARASSCST